MRVLALAMAGATAAFPSLPSCIDTDERCVGWASSGECERNAGFMKLDACRRSCNSCDADAADLAPLAVRATVAESEAFERPNAHGSCARAAPAELRWGADAALASTIGCFNRKGAEPEHSWEATRLPEYAAAAERDGDGLLVFYDTFGSRPLFRAPVNRTMAEWLEESKQHGWLSFRDEELVAENVRVLRGANGEIVSVDGTHLGHNLPDARSRYCINLVSISGPVPRRPGGAPAGKAAAWAAARARRRRREFNRNDDPELWGAL